MVHASEYRLTEPLDPDWAGVFDDLPRDARECRQRARNFVQDEVLPIIDDFWESGDYPVQLVRRMGELDLLRDGVTVPGLPVQSRVAAGLVMMELGRGDGSVAVMAGVQGGLALRSIALYGSDDQRERWLTPLARGTEFGAFALTEPAHGSDSVSLETTARTVDDGFVLDGQKMWIGNGSVGGITVVWARGDDGAVRGYLVPQETPGYSAETITGKVSVRAVWQAHITLDQVHVPADAVLPGAHSFAEVSRVLEATRLGVSWATLGLATACYEAAVHYSGQRQQFGRPLAASALVQERLARMLSRLTEVQTLLAALTRLDEQHSLRGAQASLAKYSATRAARSIAADARDLLGGNGILIGNRVARQFADIEAFHTFEGTESVQALLLGREITGRSAFNH